MGNKLPSFLFIAGVILLILAMIKGEGKAGIFIIFPFFAGSGILSIAGILLIFLSFITFFLSFPSPPQYWNEETKVEKKTGGIIFIGPIPIIFSSDYSIAKILFILASIVVFFILLLLIMQLFPS